MQSHFLVSPSNPSSGGLALLWKSDLNIQVTASCNNFVDTQITYKRTKFFSTFVYGAPEVPRRQEIWNQLTDIGDLRAEPWFLTGDFNEIIDNSEKTGGKDRPESSFSNFRSFLATNDLFDLRHQGISLSWRGTRHSHRVHCRLDRAMANSSWSDLFPKSSCIYLPFEGSDHRPLFSSFTSIKKKRGRNFCYDRSLRHNPEVTAIVEETWTKSSSVSVSSRIANC